MRFSRIISDIYDPILMNNQSSVSLGFQIPKIAFNPSKGNRTNWAVVLSSDENFWTSGNGYYMSSRPNQQDKVIFGHFTGGLGSVSNGGFSNGTQLIIADNGSGEDIRLNGDNAADDSATFRLDYNPFDNSWILFGVSDSIENPYGLTTQYGSTAIDGTHTDISLGYMGFGFDSGTKNIGDSEYIEFDYVTVSPEPSIIIIILMGSIGILSKKKR